MSVVHCGTCTAAYIYMYTCIHVHIHRKKTRGNVHLNMYCIYTYFRILCTSV